jgi:hypothetical protein
MRWLVFMGFAMMLLWVEQTAGATWAFKAAQMKT